MVRQDKRILLLDFFREQESKSKSFTYQDAADATGYSHKSVGKYISEKLKGTYVFKSDHGGWVSEGLTQMSNDDFIRLMSQSTSSRKLTPEEKMYQKLIKRSLDAFTLALEMYNRPSLSNRVEAFTIMMVNSWELFLKAEILDALGSEKVFYKNGKSISISDALPLRLQNNDPVKLNIETLIQLRDQATHLLIPELQPQLSRLFQANVLNYQERYRNQMGNSPLAGQSVGMLSLVLDGPEPEIGVIKECYGDITASEVTSFLKQFESNSKEIDSDKYSISIDYKLALTKNPSNADLTLSVGDNGQQAVIITQAKDLNTTHPHTTNEAIDKINSELGRKEVNRHSFQAICFKHKVKQNNNSPHHNFTDIHRYSESFVAWVVKNIKEQKGWLQTALVCYKNRKNAC
ncbi:TPA: DUF3644 domain-containing protein [Vibrio parahaemolyticus]|nr:DUF3644 domain-containing protein [Vibrio parahaemolyticus]ELA8172116.1 DUF3644 domain-containing protein [Vibrio parahaemolyticus]HCG5914145.1 DUF3644 domain-containing protein [Vibrio parahaemolyticus]HCG8032859.1 DUF3644 domain-containing protein [Vibrio parahaemolyticus]HCG8053762.1 DUF3644 domain-containing protein [Vibrio parahaemolyticus]